MVSSQHSPNTFPPTSQKPPRKATERPHPPATLLHPKCPPRGCSQGEHFSSNKLVRGLEEWITPEKDSIAQGSNHASRTASLNCPWVSKHPVPTQEGPTKSPPAWPARGTSVPGAAQGSSQQGSLLSPQLLSDGRECHCSSFGLDLRPN